MQNLRRGLNSRGLNKQPKNRRLNKGFTLVELSIVIAVIAILIAVLVPTFTSIINKAKKTSDQSLVSNLNTTLSVDKAINGGYDNVTEAITVLLEDYSLSDLTATADDCAIAYDMDAQEMVLLENYQPVDSEAESSKICLLGLENASAAVESGITNFCVYDNESTSVTVETEVAAEIYLYTENNTSETVVTINAANATVKQYGEAEEIIIEEVDSQSFHVYGAVDTINLTKGHVEFNDNSSTKTLYLNSNSTSFTFTENAKLVDVINNGYTPTISVKTNDDDKNEKPITENIAATLYGYNVNYRSDANSATITFVTNNGTFSQTIDNNKLTVSGLTLATSTAITRDSYRFDGWYLDESCETLFSTTNDLDGTEIKSDLTLYAKWTESYKLTYSYRYYQGNTLTNTVTETVYVPKGEKATMPADPEIEGYNFNGWYADDSFNTAFNFASTTITDDNTTVYVKMQRIECTVIFYNAYSYSGTVTALNTLTVYYGETIDGGELCSYFTNDECTPYYPVNTSVAQGSKVFKNWCIGSDLSTEFTFGSTEVKEDISVYAKWVNATVTLTLELNGGTLELSEGSSYTANTESGTTVYSIEGDYGFTATTPVTYDNETPTNIGKTDKYLGASISYTFDGWYADKGCTQEYTFGVVEGDTTIYAKWDCVTEVINGVIYSKVTPTSKAKTAGSTTVTFGNDTNNITVEDITSYWVITGYIQSEIDRLGYYDDGSWLVLENTIYGYPVLEIAAGAFARGYDSYLAVNSSGHNMTLKNVLVPENIVMVGSQAFLDNKGVESIVFLAEKVYFSSDTDESTTVDSITYKNGYANVSVIDYNNHTTNDLEKKDNNSQKYPFYGCTALNSDNSANDSSSTLSVYYRSAYSTTPNTTDTENVNPLNGGVFVVKRDKDFWGKVTYLRTSNDSSTTMSPNISKVDWLYINTASYSASLECGEIARGDFDWASAITNAITSYGATYFVDGDNIFIACELGKESDTGSLYNHFIASIENAIDEFTAEYGEYIHGYNVTDLTTVTGVNGNEILFSIEQDTDNTYYRVNVSQQLTVGNVTNDWSLAYVADSATTTDNNDETTTVSVTYKATVDYAGEDTTVYVTVTFTGKNVEFFEYTESCYSTYYNTKNSGSYVFASGSVTIKGSSDFNYKLSTVNGSKASTEEPEGTITYASVSVSSAANDATLGWEQIEDNFIYIVSGIAFTYTDGTNSTAIKKTAEGGTGTPLLASHVAEFKGNLGTSTDNITTEEKGYYFLGWAKYDGDDLTFTDIGVNSFDNATIYYAIWGYWDFAVKYSTKTKTYALSGYDVSTSSTTLPKPTSSDDSFSFFG